jgi:hypothetical protein
VRLGLEAGIPVHFIDRDTEDYPVDYTPLPDAYAITRIGHYRYCIEYIREHEDTEGSREDILREKTMAYNLQRLNNIGKRTIFVGGIYHIPRLLRMVNMPQYRRK